MKKWRTYWLALIAFLLTMSHGLSQSEPPGQGPVRIRGADPNRYFDALAKGKEVLNRSEMSPVFLPMFDKMAESLGVTNGQITRDQFIKYRAEQAQNRLGNGGAPLIVTTPPGGPEKSLVPINTATTVLATPPELPIAYPASKTPYLPPRNNDIQPQVPPAKAPEKNSKPKIYRHDNLPKELPPWFKELDTDRDGQVALYEWKASGRSLAEFMRMDRNNDGFLTVDEVLHYQAHKKAGPEPVTVTTAGPRGETAITTSAEPDRARMRRPRGGPRQ
jgi:hypothetical protein